jgi:uncharacterized protein YllA (UPF0747 family)
VHLFHHTPERAAIHTDGKKFRAGEMSFSGDVLHEAINSNPLDFSPDALTRPLLQSYFFPVISVVVGPSEAAYYAQIMPLFDNFNLAPPEIMARPSMTLVEKRFEKLLNQYGLSLVDLTGDIEPIVNNILRDTYPDKIDKKLAELSVNLNDELRKLISDLERIDPGLKDNIDQVGKKIDYHLKDLGRKIFAAHKKKNKIERDRIHRLQKNLYPNRNLAERSIAPAYLISRYGPKVIDFIYENISLDETGHRLLMLSEYNG